MEDQIDMNKVEQHPLPPFFPADAQVLMLGSFPPQRIRWKMEFYYPNFQNDMWRIFGAVFFNDQNHFIIPEIKSFDKEKIIEFLEGKGIALSDTAKSVIRLKDNASDKFLQIVDVIDLSVVLKEMPLCHTIVTTGQKATDTLLTVIEANEPKVGCYSEFEYLGRQMRFYRMPSSSRAYPKPLLEKALIYKKMFHDLGMV